MAVSECTPLQYSTPVPASSQAIVASPAGMGKTRVTQTGQEARQKPGFFTSRFKILLFYLKLKLKFFPLPHT